MKTPGVGIAVCLSSVVLASSVGCVSKEQYEKLDSAYNKCNEHREQLQQELQAEKDRNDALNSRLEGIQGQLAGKDGELARLQQDKNALTAALAKMKAAADAALNQPIVEPKIVIRPLPPELHKTLQEFARKYPDMVEYDANRGAVKWKSDLLFALGSDIVKDSAKPSLNAFAKIAGSSAAAQFDTIVVGHTCNVRIARRETRQAHPTNWHLSVHRSISVNNVLMQSGVAKTRTGVMGYGEFRPIAPNTNEAGRQKNRRVEIYLVNRKVLGVTQSDGMTWLKDGSLAFARPK